MKRRHRKRIVRILIKVGLPIVIVAALSLVIFLIIQAVQNKMLNKADDGLDNESIEQSLDEEIEVSNIEVIDKEDADSDADADDPQEFGTLEAEDSTTTEEVKKEILNASTVAENESISYGIDVAKYQGTIDWSKVAASGIEFAIIRVGYRTQNEGKIMADTNAKYNMQEAQANGIKVGVYFFSTAINEAEAVEEANWVADYINQYQITYPVAYNCEGYEKSTSRQYSLSQTQRTTIAKAFLNQIYDRGYTPMFYASRNELSQEAKWDTSTLENSYKMWVAHYPGSGYDYASGPDYAGTCDMWQYSASATVDGISKKVDLDIAYFAYEGSAKALDSTAPEVATADVEALMKFTEVNETVTAKNKTNLRDIPSQGSDSTVKATLVNPDTATRTGISDSGWSRLVYGDQVYYAVSSYLTTDLSAPAQGSQVAQDDGGIKTKFTSCNDIVTAKQEVNLRSLPSVTNEQSQVIAVLYNGQTVTRTGYNAEYGWSRVDYNGQTLYCITSYLTTPAQ